MTDAIRIVGVHPITADEPCHLVEIELRVPPDQFDFGRVTQVTPGQPKDNWQVAYDEREIGKVESGSRWAFYFHYLDLGQSLLTPLGPIAIPAPTPIPDHLSSIEYDEP